MVFPSKLSVTTVIISLSIVIFSLGYEVHGNTLSYVLQIYTFMHQYRAKAKVNLVHSTCVIY